jgi:hypothetical protein
MSNPHGRNADGKYPGFLSPWCKIQLGWLDPIEPQADGDFTLQPSNLEGEVIKISRPYPEQEYLLIENRQDILYDELLWRGGLLIYHVDDFKRGQMERGYPGQRGWPGNGKHYQVALLSPDGNYDLEKGTDQGDAGDYWKPGHVLGPSVVEQVASSRGTYPNTNSYQFGNIAPTGVWIYDIRGNGQGDVSFRISGLSPPEPSPAPTPLVIESAIPGPVPFRTRQPYARPANKDPASVSLAQRAVGGAGRGSLGGRPVARRLKGLRNRAKKLMGYDDNDQ